MARDRDRPGSTLRRTKIVATIGPASRDAETLRGLIDAGADVLRINFSHGTRAEHAENVTRIREVSERAGLEIGILGDLPGPKLRIDEIEGGVVTVHSGSELILTTEERLGDAHNLSVTWDGLPAAVKRGEPIYLADGRVRMRVLEATPTEIHSQVEAGGSISSHQGINLPESQVSLPSAGEEDLTWVDFACETGVDLLAVSFVRSRKDLVPVEERLRERDADIPLIAKIEKPEAAANAEEIVAACHSGIMVARGDLGIEVPIAQVPVLQKRLIALAGQGSKPVITATQMLASMVNAPTPTRAEVTDVANAIFDGTDAVMLSEETAVGHHPVEAVRVMDRIAYETEPELPYGDWLFSRVATDHDDVAGSVARAAVGSTYTLGLAALVVPTNSGRTARLVSSHRPKVPVLAVSPRSETVRRLNLLFGVRCAQSPIREDFRELLADCARLAREHRVAESGELIGVTAGLPDQELGTNLFEVHRVP
ncbi:MAG: pyruvate kinase [Solirubrobacterales bacterium]